MASSIRLRVFVALLLASVVLAGGLSAEERLCKRIDGTVRPCTPSETLRRCMHDTYDAFFQCIADRNSEDDPGSFGYAVHATVCQIGLGFDQAACVVEAGKVLAM